eukprot:CAMPEP_0194364718 /NCGR_PEP_ID=MMETSP0174-20130528/12622_1 /TAXON_ID=216777 /ORGANISM="Proboscia alata, Strain PI-D3" /LENGTH=726 /DNA_ID=CAMNT_0039138895 /DNA_START=363 /DNA_END=2543 /DNA_ORIENTATION=+
MKHMKCIDIADITHVKTGFVSTQSLEFMKKTQRGFCSGGVVSIFFHETDDGRTILNLIINDKTQRDNLINLLKRLLETYHNCKLHVGNLDLLVRYVWNDIDADQNGGLDEKEVKKLLKRLNAHSIKSSELHKSFITEVGTKNGLLSFSQTMSFLHTLKGLGEKSTEDLIWDQVFGKDTEHVSKEEFLQKFLLQHQHETNLDDLKVREIFDHSHKMEIGALCLDNTQTSGEFKRPHFDSYLHGKFNSVFDHDDEEHDESCMTSPLSHYWINTSHNTYLTGSQLTSYSSVEVYMNVLQRGCKCVEIDCWDGWLEENDTKSPVPVVHHGYTLTSKIRFEDVLECIGGYVDTYPDTYPIVLSIENHCSIPYQHVMASKLECVLGDKLYIPIVTNGVIDHLPSPLELKGKIVIKGKRITNVTSLSIKDESDEEDSDEDVNQEKKIKHKIVPELSRLTLLHGKKFHNFEESILQEHSHMHSISENKSHKILKSDKMIKLWRQYNVSHMTRTYPKGTRINSDNYNPLFAWALGCQMVALNMQSHDVANVLNDGRFRMNGGCGYVRKPDWLLNQHANNFSGDAMNVKIRILGGCCLPKPKGRKAGEVIDPFVTVTLHDVKVSGDGNNDNNLASLGQDITVETTHKTSCVNDNGFCPAWNETKGKEFTVLNPDIAIFHFNVKDADMVSSADNIADAAVPVAALKKGFRNIQLHDKKSNQRRGPFDFATLLIEIVF